MLKIRFTEAAETDLVKAHDWYEGDVAYIAAIFHFSRSPRMWRKRV